MVLKPLTRYYIINIMFGISIIYLFYFGILFGINPNFLSSQGYEWFPYRLWYTKKGLFMLLGFGMMGLSAFLAYILFKFNKKLFQVQQMIEYSVHFSARNIPILTVSFCLITVMKFSIIGTILRCFEIMQSSEPIIEPLDCKTILPV